MKLCFIDEVGVSSIAGPVMVCAVAVPEDMAPIPGVNDSKKLSKKKREELFPILQSDLIHEFGSACPKKIERLNIHWAKLDAMRIAVEKLLRMGIDIDKVVVDGSFTIPGLTIRQEAVVKADAKFWQCGAASILAKVKRDRMMTELATLQKYSYYDWQNNAGYYTPAHRLGIVLHGPTMLHRRNFDYFKYCMFGYRKCQEFVREGGTFEDFEKWAEAERSGKSDYVAWRDGVFDVWKEIPYGSKP
jgi:ribonuclease HII